VRKRGKRREETEGVGDKEGERERGRERVRERGLWCALNSFFPKVRIGRVECLYLPRLDLLSAKSNFSEIESK